MQKTPKISVIVPVYNCKDLIRRALDSILPLEDDVQLILIDDGSTDGSWQEEVEWWGEHIGSKGHHTIMRFDTNQGVASAMNLGFELAQGEYIVSLSSDDYYVRDFSVFRPYLDGENDLVYFNLEVNDGTVWDVDEKSKETFVGAVKFIRREFLGKTRIPSLRYCEDLPFSQALQEKNPKEAFTHIVLKHYNFPREGSLIWQANHKEGNNGE